MTNRIYIGSDRVTMSKPGYDAVSPPAIDYKYLSLDSRLNSGRPLEVGVLSNLVYAGNYYFTTTYPAVPGVDVVLYGTVGPAGAYAYSVPAVMRDANASTAYNRTQFYLATFTDHFQVVDDFPVCAIEHDRHRASGVLCRLAGVVMVNRVLAGFHAGFGQMGFWLSQPGVEVTVPGGPGNFILRPDLKYMQIVMSGAVTLSPGQQINIPLPVDFVQHPFVLMKGSPASNAGYIEYPSALGAVGGTGSDPAEIAFYMYAANNYLQFYNPNGAAVLSGYFMLYNRSIGS